MVDLAALDATRIAAACAGGSLNPGDVVRAFRQRIDDLNPTLNAVVGEVPRGLDADVALLRKRVARGESLPLAGVPVIVKDTIWVRDQRVTQGSLLFSDFVARQDALAVERLRRAGALVIGMGNSSEFACKGLTTNKVYGLTRHPMDPTLTPGGSSGGCAAAVAARLAPLALGTDGGGSSRRPPAHVGVVGFKPSFGAIADPIGFPHAFIGLQSIAPIARSVADARAKLTACRIQCSEKPAGERVVDNRHSLCCRDISVIEVAAQEKARTEGSEIARADAIEPDLCVVRILWRKAVDDDHVVPPVAAYRHDL